MAGQVIQIPYHPRPQQKAISRGMREKRWGAIVCHRRMGKTIGAVNILQQGALTCKRSRPRYAYIAPTYRQGKAVAWDEMQHYARPIPGVEFNQSELRIDYPQGGQVRIYGGDNADSLRGLYLDGVVCDEYGMMDGDIFTTVLRPALADRGGWALFAGTPNGKNQFYDVCQHAEHADDWFFARYRASETGLLSPEELAAARAVMTQDEYDQEFECSFEASIKGAIYTKELSTARAAGQMAKVPYDPALPVDTAWDLGVGDQTSIWFAQSLRGGEVRLIDYHEASGEGLPYYAQVLKSKGYVYGRHWAPHDIQVRELASGRSRIESAAALGIKFAVVPQVGIEDGIHAARLLLPRCWFDAEKCAAGIEALMHYRRDYNSRLREFKAVPVHDWASHGADAFRYLAVAIKAPVDAERKTRPYVPASRWS